MRLRPRTKLKLKNDIKCTNVIQGLLAQIEHKDKKIKDQQIEIKKLDSLVRKKRQCFLVYPVDPDKSEHLMDGSLEKIDTKEIIKNEFYNINKQFIINRLKERDQTGNSSPVVSMDYQISENLEMLVDDFNYYFNSKA
jgi:hypothetical protein